MNKLLVTVAVASSGAAIILATRGQTFSRVEAGGPTVRMLIAGKGDVTVVFESGAGAPLEAWTRIQPAVSEFAKTISYDRAGNGLSTKGPTPRDGHRIASELRAALRNAHASPPYLLVGHSLGGPYIRVFASLYPDEVAGLVLVDPTQEDLIAWAKTRESGPTNEHEFRPYDEVDCAPLTFAQAHDDHIPPDVPVVLIAGLGPRAVPNFLPRQLKQEVQKDQEVFYPAKKKFYEEWIRKFPAGLLITTDQSGHGIPFEEPELVIKAIREIVGREKAGGKPTTIPPPVESSPTAPPLRKSPPRSNRPAL